MDEGIIVPPALRISLPELFQKSTLYIPGIVDENIDPIVQPPSFVDLRVHFRLWGADVQIEDRSTGIFQGLKTLFSPPGSGNDAISASEGFPCNVLAQS